MDYAGVKNALSASFWPIYDCAKTGVDLKQCLFSFDAAGGLAWLYVLISLYCFVFAELSGNYSKVDQIWSVTPWAYCWFLYYHSDMQHDRLLLVCILTTIWGARLTYNFWRRDGYGNLITHEEDYRWPILRKKFNNRFLFACFNATFIAPYQNLILLLIAAPAYHVYNGPQTCNTADYVVACVFVGLLIMETSADQQHWNFHHKKYSVPAEQRKLHPDADVRDGFLQSGLFQLSRHPNYFAEQSIWVSIYCFTLTHANITKLSDLVNVYSLGVALLISLFQGSINFGESITASKYPMYKEYQRRTSQCIPFFSGPRTIKKA